MTASILIFTDLDGTLLDHADYSYESARPTLEILAARNIPLVLCTSKTASEISHLRADPLLSHCPAIVENGAGILQPGCDQPKPEARHAELLNCINQSPTKLRVCFSGFSDWSLQTLQANTGLDEVAARRAARRDYTEPGLWNGKDDERQRFLQALGEVGVHAQQGGRFLTLGFGANKADRMLELVAEQRGPDDKEVVSIALGDAPNDTEMLLKSDYGIIIPNPAHAGIPTLDGEASGRILRAASAGPKGWSDSLLALLNDPGFPAMET